MVVESQIIPPRIPPPRPPIRWWPVWLILICAAVAWWVVGVISSANHQAWTLRSLNVGIWTLLAIVLWAVLFSRLPARTRWLILGSFILSLGGMVLCFDIHGVTGDVFPILKWRWSGKPVFQNMVTKWAPAPSTNVAQSGWLQDYPQFMGPTRDGLVTGLPLSRNWQNDPPQIVWRKPMGTAWSAFAVSQRYAVTQEQRGEDECVTCYDTLTGDFLWQHADRAHYQSKLAGEGPRATPTIVSNRVFATGSTGILNCLDLASGHCLWTRNILQENQGKLPGWGFSSSPLAMEDKIIVHAGGPQNLSLVAYRQTDGKVAWAGGKTEAHYSSPCPTVLAHTPQILLFHAHGLTAHNSTNGQVLWEHPWPGGHPHVTMPVVIPGDRILISSGYGAGCELLQVHHQTNGVWSTERLWKNARLKSKFANVVFFQNCFYGLDDGILVCLDAVNGERKWKGSRYGHGQMILVDGLLLLSAENGDLILIEPAPDEPKELSRFPVFQNKTWNPPALAGQWLLMRNDLEAACLKLPLAR